MKAVRLRLHFQLLSAEGQWLIVLSLESMRILRPSMPQKQTKRMYGAVIFSRVFAR
jgi:hypothetical protein